MPLVTCLSKSTEVVDHYPTSSSAGAPLDPVIPISTHNPSPSTSAKLGPSPQDIEAFMNKPGNATIVNAIIDENINTIMEKFQKDKIEEPTFANPILLLDPSHPLFGKLPPPIGHDDPNHPLYIPHKENKPTMFEAMDPNVPSTQLGAPITPHPQNSITQSLVHTTSHQPIFTQTTLPFFPIGVATSQLASLPLHFPPHIMPQNRTYIPSISISGAFI